ncbi:MAG: type I restriction enzyme HsdR N-terminal domain-containing protein [Bacteroidota bacterium]
MQQLNFPPFKFKLRVLNDRQEIFDPVRHKFVALTPEEWVRQHLIAYLTEIKGYPVSLIGVEKQLVLNKQLKRFDLVVFKRNASPLLLVECKAPGVGITEKAFDQAARYNMLLKADYFFISNGLEHYTCRIDYESKQYVFIEDIPAFDEVRSLIV